MPEKLKEEPFGEINPKLVKLSLIVVINLLNNFREVLFELICPITLKITVRPGNHCDNCGWTVNTLGSLGDSVGLYQQYSK